MSQQKVLAIYHRFHPNLLGRHLNLKNLEVYLSQMENEIFKISKEQLGYPNLSNLEWEAVRSLTGDRSIVIKKADKGSCLVVWDRLDYLTRRKNNLRTGKFIKKSGLAEIFLLIFMKNSRT